MNNTLNNGLGLLSIVANAVRPYGVTELARNTSLPKSHVHRLLQSLVEAGLLDKTGQGQYCLSVGILKLSRELLMELPIRNAAYPEMMLLIKTIDFNLTLAVPYGDDALSVAYIAGDGQLRDAGESLGSVLGAMNSASGKLFLAYKSGSEQDRILDELALTKAETSALRQELAQILREDCSIKARGTSDAIKSFALPIRDGEGQVVAALGGSARDDSLSPARVLSLIPAFRESVYRIEQHLTHTDHD